MPFTACSAEPKTLTEVSAKAKETLETAATKTEVVLGTYEVDKVKFDEGLKAFRADNFVSARDFFARADTEKRDSKTQFYIAYSFYRQGFGKVYNDDELFKQGLEQTNRVIQIDKNFRADDADLKLKTDDFNPVKWTRERK